MQLTEEQVKSLVEAYRLLLAKSERNSGHNDTARKELAASGIEEQHEHTIQRVE